jgi:hypothetical protein
MEAYVPAGNQCIKALNKKIHVKYTSLLITTTASLSPLDLLSSQTPFRRQKTDKVQKCQIQTPCGMHFPSTLFKYWLVIQAVQDVTSSLKMLPPRFHHPSLSLNSFIQSVLHPAVMICTGCLTSEKEVHQQSDTAGIPENRGHYFAHN